MNSPRVNSGSALTKPIVAAVKALIAGETYKAINAKYGIPDSVTIDANAVDASAAK